MKRYSTYSYSRSMKESTPCPSSQIDNPIPSCRAKLIRASRLAGVGKYTVCLVVPSYSHSKQASAWLNPFSYSPPMPPASAVPSRAVQFTGLMTVQPAVNSHSSRHEQCEDTSNAEQRIPEAYHASTAACTAPADLVLYPMFRKLLFPLQLWLVLSEHTQESSTHDRPGVWLPCSARLRLDVVIAVEIQPHQNLLRSNCRQ